MNDSNEVSIVIEDDGPLLIILVMFVVLVSIVFQLVDYSRQRRKLAVEAGHNQETRQRSRQFFYTVIILGMLTLVANYITGVTSSLAASHLDEMHEPANLLSLPGLWFTLGTLVAYGAAVTVMATLFLRKERIELPELLADLHDARKYGGLATAAQIHHYESELSQVLTGRDSERVRQRTDGEFAEYFTSNEQEDRPDGRSQWRFLRTDPGHRERRKFFLRRLLLDYRIPAGKWLLPLAVVTGVAVYGFIAEAAKPDVSVGKYVWAGVWLVAAAMSAAALLGQYRVEIAKILLKSRKEYVSDAVEAECRAVLQEAEVELHAAQSRAAAILEVGSRPAPVGPVGGSFESILRLGRWELGRRRTPPR